MLARGGRHGHGDAVRPVRLQPARQLHRARPHHAAPGLGQVVRREGVHRLARPPLAAEGDEGALGDPHHFEPRGGDVDERERHARLLPAREEEGAGVEGQPRGAVGHRHRHGRLAVEAQPVLRRQALAQHQPRRGAVRQARDAQIFPLARHRKAGQWRLGAHPVRGLPVRAPRGRDGEAQAGAGRLGLRLDVHPRDQHARGAARLGQLALERGVRRVALERPAQGVELLQGPVQALHRLRDHQERRDLGRPGGDEREGLPAGLRGSPGLGRGAAELRAGQREPVLGPRLAGRDPLLPGLGGGGPVVAPLGRRGAGLGGGALRRRGAGGKAGFERLLVARGVARQAGEVHGLGVRGQRKRERRNQHKHPTPHVRPSLPRAFWHTVRRRVTKLV